MGVSNTTYCPGARGVPRGVIRWLPVKTAFAVADGGVTMTRPGAGWGTLWY